MFTTVIQGSRVTLWSRARSKRGMEGRGEQIGRAPAALGSPLLGGCLVKYSSQEGGGPWSVGSGGHPGPWRPGQGLGEGHSDTVPCSGIDRQTA